MRRIKSPVSDKDWKKLKQRAPKVPDYTCPQIDDVLARIEKIKEKQRRGYRAMTARRRSSGDDEDCVVL